MMINGLKFMRVLELCEIQEGTELEEDVSTFG